MGKATIWFSSSSQGTVWIESMSVWVTIPWHSFILVFQDVKRLLEVIEEEEDELAGYKGEAAIEEEEYILKDDVNAAIKNLQVFLKDNGVEDDEDDSRFESHVSKADKVSHLVHEARRLENTVYLNNGKASRVGRIYSF